MLYWFAYFLLWLLSKMFFPFRIFGREKIPSGNMIIASNHTSNLDPVILGLAFHRHTSYLAKDSLFKNKIFGFILLHVSSAFPIKRNTADIGALKEAIRRLRKGGSLVVFPEGTRKATAEERKPQEGIGFLAIKSGVPVLPAYISGSDQVLPPGAKWFKRGAINVVFGEPVRFAPTKDYANVSAQILERIDALKT
jgi:1-acyl-sn-glycerol-3-phosphate acyltransferase